MHITERESNIQGAKSQFRLLGRIILDLSEGLCLSRRVLGAPVIGTQFGILPHLPHHRAKPGLVSPGFLGLSLPHLK